ncbi:outer membrane beta-barrel protein [Roseobacter sp. HKCCA0434]|uniref:outer membrane beta-barrel protein n=1 Tax=Roseobacter sp. HKCCA0434 TaxID=3079297 RepID=UPI002905D470|nr:outer membrane beta-barrel protein [Roseobacter sp. HKCCA0434]
MMLTRLLGIVCLPILSAGLAHAQTAGEGLYLGAAGGGQLASLDGGPEADGGTLEGFAGYAFEIGDSAFVAGEVNYTISGADDNGLDLDDSYGVGALAGYDVTRNTAVYGRLGYQRGEGETPGGNFDEDGLRYGLGVDMDGPAEYRLRIEVDRIEYQDVDGGADLDADRLSVGVYRFF